MPVLGLIGAVATLLLVTLRKAPVRVGWKVPAGLSLAFALFTVYAIAVDGVFGFWAVHVANYWGNQVWLDLLIAISIGWLALLPQMRALGIRPLPWLLLVFATGCIGLLAAVARILYVRENAANNVTMRANSAAW